MNKWTCFECEMDVDDIALHVEMFHEDLGGIERWADGMIVYDDADQDVSDL